MNVLDLPWTTSDIAGVGGRLKEQPEDFEVEEIPSYDPSGEGVHVYLWLEKRGLPMDVALRRVAGHFGGRGSDVGHAGIKDARAVTRQWVSVLDEQGAIDVDGSPGEVDLGPGLRILRWARHGNRLRTGHLRGNRFRIVVRDPVEPSPARLALATLTRMASMGMPNFYGPQRFGRDGATLSLGLGILSGTLTGKARRAGRDRFRRRLAISAVQSHLFNDYLVKRLQREQARTVLLGDLMRHRPHGAVFEAVDVDVEQARVDAGEIVVTGPMYGHKMAQATGDAGVFEASVLEDSGLSREHFLTVGKLGKGARRPLLVFPTEVAVDDVEGGVEVRFALPSGCYATVLLGEIMGVEEARA
jgi:tRNA pseudouridine13 synthase